jgi:hypothetical protein
MLKKLKSKCHIVSTQKDWPLHEFFEDIVKGNSKL